MDVRGIMGLIIVLVVGLSLTSVVQSQTTSAINGGTPDNTDDDITGAAATILGLVPLFYVIGLLLAAVAWATKGFEKKGG